MAYRLTLPTALARIHNVLHISMLKKYTLDELHIVSWEQVELTEDDLYTEELVCILDRKEQVLQTKTILLVKVLWSHHGEEEATWEREAEVMDKYPHLFGSTLQLGSSCKNYFKWPPNGLRKWLKTDSETSSVTG
ncbi:uncharacterized protein LOC131220012 [Magnolia sinica]|uniref:uncharacterized protein LOC131220012 n=1 Tax=Magnolia sinica TaxID=86752 RepID=UPI00265ABCEC|nr:uncharacterized protein LOC131220012 [Magnolia sinica]